MDVTFPTGRAALEKAILDTADRMHMMDASAQACVCLAAVCAVVALAVALYMYRGYRAGTRTDTVRAVLPVAALVCAGTVLLAASLWCSSQAVSLDAELAEMVQYYNWRYGLLPDWVVVRL